MPNENVAGVTNAQIEMVPVASLFFDRDNPRFPSSVMNSSDEQILKWMLNDATITELMGSIGEKGYFPAEPLLVVPRQAEKDTFTVIEGNRRLSAVKLLRNPEFAPVRTQTVKSVVDGSLYRPEQLPVVIYNKREDILDYLGYRHITGVKSWGALEKAKYLKQLMDANPIGKINTNETFRDLAKTIGSRSDYVANLLTGLMLYQKIVDQNFFRIKSLEESRIDFSLLTTAIRYDSIAKFLGLTSATDVKADDLKIDALNELTHWVYEKNDSNKTRLGESRNISKLNNIVNNEKALAAFRGGRTIDEAEIFTRSSEDAFRLAYQNAKTKVEDSRNLAHLVDNPTETDIDVVSEISRIARGIVSILRDKKEQSEE